MGDRQLYRVATFMRKKNLTVLVKMIKTMLHTGNIYKRSKHKSFVIFALKVRHACFSECDFRNPTTHQVTEK